MCNPVLAALLGLAAGCGAPAAPAVLLAPADPHAATRWHPPPSPLAGVKRYTPVDARNDWGDAPASPPDRTAPDSGTPGMSKPGTAMPGRDMKGMDMKGMPGMDGR